MVYPVKRELKKEENDAEELKPPIRVFVDPAEVPGREVNQEDEVSARWRWALAPDSLLNVKPMTANLMYEDPLAPDGEFFCCKIEGSAGGEYVIEGTVNDSKTRPGSAVEANSDCRKGDDLALGSTGVKPNQRVARKKSSSKNASRFSKRNSASEDELSFCGETQSEEFAHECSDCHKSFKWKSHLVMHMRIHNGERPYACSQCPKAFRQKSDLEGHLRIHSGERPYECSDCEKSFAARSTLVTHMRVYGGENIYDCSVCHRLFARKSYLERHMLITTGNLLICCSVWPKNVSNRSNLSKHTDSCRKRSYERFCQRSFVVSRDLEKDILIHSSESVHECSVCHYKFSQRSTFIARLPGLLWWTRSA